MRRAVLAAAQEEPESRRLLPWLSPAWGGALVMAAALLLALGLWWLPNRGEPAPERVAVQKPAPVPQAPPALPPPPAPPVAERAAPEPDATLAAAPEPAPPPPALPPAPAPPLPEPEAGMALAEAALAETAELDWSEVPASPAAAAGEALPRQVQLTTPGGTRVIWVLDPRDDATQEAHSAGPEEKTE
jgi:outer membrane biosynthesis protein TonB